MDKQYRKQEAIMAAQDPAAAPHSYERLGRRIQRAASAPRARLAHSIIIERQPDESIEDWERVIEEIETHGHVTITRFDDGSVGLRWNLAETL